MTAPDCPFPATCPVPSPSGARLRHLHTTVLDASSGYHTVSSAGYWPSLFNPSGRGNSRFSPLSANGTVLPTVYGSRTQTAALLETVFHDVHASAGRRLIYYSDLARRNMVDFELPERLVLWDLRDPALARLGLQRAELISTTAAHYPCTRQWAQVLHERKAPAGARPAGLIWDSRVAELARGDALLLADLLAGQPDEVFILFGDRVSTTGPASYSATQRYDDLSSVAALPLVGVIAEFPGATLA